MISYNRLPKGFLIQERYEIESILGTGKSATVYKTLDKMSQTWVALKVLDPFLVQDPINVERFKREAQAIRLLEHPNVIKVFSLFREGEMHCICMEYFEGMSLKEYLKEKGAVPLQEFKSIAEQLIGALESCHKKNLIHRDIKPQNILINSSYEVKLLDFGISKINTMSDLTKTGTFLGTPEYMAPELFSSHTPDLRSDVYSLGAVFYELLTGAPPYPAGAIQHILAKQAKEEIPPISDFRQDLPAWIECCLRKALKVNAQHRYQTLYELKRDFYSGSKAVAVTEMKRERIVCFECKTEMLTGLPFCYQCGKFASSVYEGGKFSLAIYRSDDPKTLGEHLKRYFTNALNRNPQSALKRLPAILFNGISQKTAVALYNELARLPCELHVIKNASTELKLPKRYVISALLMVTPVYVFRFLGPTLFGIPVPELSLLWVIITESLIVANFLLVTRPVMKLKGLSSDAAPKLHEKTLQLASRINSYESPRLRFVAASIARSYLDLIKPGCLIPPQVAIELEKLLREIWDIGQVLIQLEAMLKQYAGAGLKEKRKQLELKIKHETNLEKAAEWIKEKGKVEAELRRFQEIQELYTQLSIAFIQIQSLLNRLEVEQSENKSHWEGSLNELKEILSEWNEVIKEKKAA